MKWTSLTLTHIIQTNSKKNNHKNVIFRHSALLDILFQEKGQNSKIIQHGGMERGGGKIAISVAYKWPFWLYFWHGSSILRQSKGKWAFKSKSFNIDFSTLSLIGKLTFFSRQNKQRNKARYIAKMGLIGSSMELADFS